MYRALLDSGMQHEWIPENIGKCHLSETKIKEYLSRLDTEYHTFVKRVLDNTVYITYDIFLHHLKAAFADFKREIGTRPFSLILCPGFGSENWLLQLLWSEIREMDCELVCFDTDDSSSPYLRELPREPSRKDIICIDDAILSGINIYGMLEQMTIDFDVDDATMHIVVPFATKEGLKWNTYHTKETKTYAQYEIPVIDISDCKLPRDISANCPFYFDHKVAGEFSSFPCVYLYTVGVKMGSLFDVDPSRSVVDRLWKFYQSQ